MDRLTRLCNKYGTDKGTTSGDAHGFSVFYEPFFSKLENPTILEIGVYKGGFEKAISDYYDGECTVYCVDVVDYSENFEGYDNIKFFQCDCGVEESIKELLEKLGGVKFDVVIDDGSHMWSHQFLSILYFRRLVKEGGYFIMEDLHSSFDPFFIGSLNVNISPMDMLSHMAPCSFYLPEENEEILNSISESFLYMRHNPNRIGVGDVFARSATVVLKIGKWLKDD